MTTWADEKAMAIVRHKAVRFRSGTVGIRFETPPGFGIVNRLLIHPNGKILKWRRHHWHEVDDGRFRNAILMALWPEFEAG